MNKLLTIEEKIAMATLGIIDYKATYLVSFDVNGVPECKEVRIKSCIDSDGDDLHATCIEDIYGERLNV